MGGLYGGGDEPKGQGGFTCGRQLPGYTVQRPDLQAVSCRGRQFEIVIGDRHPAPDNRTQVTTHCVSCHGQDPMLLLMTNAGESLMTAAQVPALMQRNANPGLLVCASCQQFRFILLDQGNEIRRRCLGCGDTQHLGYESQAGNQTHGRSFGTGTE